jgi:iron uptake system component EfeO
LSRHRSTRIALIGATAAAALLLAGCGSDGAADPGNVASVTDIASSSSAAASAAAASPAAAASAAAGSAAGGSAAGRSAAGGATAVTVTITAADGCTVEPNTVPAGPVTFTISNVDATAVSEVHLMGGDRIRGERENLAPGFDGNFSVTLDGGSYQVLCPGAATETQPFTVTGKAAQASGDVNDLLAKATSDYSEYVSTQADYLVGATAELATALKSGDLKKSQQAYAKARPFYERIEPVAESFGDLDPDIDARDGDVPAAQWKGFHQIEKALFVDKSVAKAEPFMADLTSNVAKLKSLTAELAKGTEAGDGKGYQPDEVANGASSLLEEVQKSKISGEEERYSHIDLLDFAANVEGSQQAFAALTPALDKIDPQLAPPISARFAALNTLLESHRDAAALGGYALYTDLSKAEVKALADALLAVQEPLSQVSAKVASAG